jgi:uncharacterized protein (DUF1330 family)
VNGISANPVSLCVLLWAKPGKESALSAYEDQVLGLLADHGGRVLQRGSVIADSSGAGHGEQPAEVQFLEFPSEAALAAYMNDPRRQALAAERDAAIAMLRRANPEQGHGPARIFRVQQPGH